ncbi:MAG TPA: hypothetical protein VMX13_17750 [Sedimentisphaerales bacterium]|nr:hypothetical protein [Sedimentisphaerales bacterium]
MARQRAFTPIDVVFPDFHTEKVVLTRLWNLKRRRTWPADGGAAGRPEWMANMAEY